MDKQLIERIALEVAKGIQVPLMPEGTAYFVTADLAIEICTRFLSRIDAERGKSAVAWLHESRREADVITTAVKNVWGGVAVGNMAAYSIPLFLSPIPTIPPGWALVPIEPTQAMLDAPSNSWPADAKMTWAAMLDAVQGERK